jgi:soluble lytic murein transglycosylase-like protein
MPFAAFLEKALEDSENMKCELDPLLFMALMKRESAFDPKSISSVGAAGLTQIMPQTALKMGMRNIYRPDYFVEAMDLAKKQKQSRRKARALLYQINKNNALEKAKNAREKMQKSIRFRYRKEKLLDRYRRQLLKSKKDDRLIPAKAIAYGLRYFSEMIRKQKGDISLALASYNAGPHRVREYLGIPPFRETVRFRNKVLQFYREYRETAQGNQRLTSSQ